MIRLQITSKVRTSTYPVEYILLHLLLIASCYPGRSEDVEVEDTENNEEPLLEGDFGRINILGMDDENTTKFADRSDEEWVRDAVLDVAYYLRSHKFNDFDRRYYKKIEDEDIYQYQQFPKSPLRYLHWEVYKYCEEDFYNCLAYLQDTALQAVLVRSLDTSVVMNDRHWEFPRNSKSIDKLDKECVRLRNIDWRDGDPFKGPLERFQWRVSASYYMCFYTMKNLSPLAMFGERCDNFANCLQNNTANNNDPRADDSKPYQCAMYSFCPDVCCPMRQISDVKDCLLEPRNPCAGQKEVSNRQCTFSREQNKDFVAIALNQWNITCNCEAGYEWDSQFGMCIDVDECLAGRHSCSPNQVCINLQGSHACICAWGYINVTGSCVPNRVLTNAMAGLHKHYHVTTTTPRPRPISLLKSLFKFMFFKSHMHGDITTTEPTTGNQSKAAQKIDLNPE